MLTEHRLFVFLFLYTACVLAVTRVVVLKSGLGLVSGTKNII